MTLPANRTIHVIGLIALTFGLLGTAQTLRAQAVPSTATDSTEPDAPAKSASRPMPRAEALAAISENNHLILLPWYNLGQAPAGPWVAGYMKLVTPIAQNENNMFSLKIKGYRYGTGGTPVEIRCGGYAYSGTNSLISSDCLTEGTPDRVGIGTENGYVIVTIGSNESGQGVWYYDHLTAEYSGDSAKNANDFNWQFVYNATPSTTNTHNVVIRDSAGTVGIGTASPSGPLHVKGGSAMSGGWNRTGVFESTFPVVVFNSASSKWAGVGYDYSVDAMRFWTGATSADVSAGALAMTISGGKVGIGTGTPSSTLHVDATTANTAVAQLRNLNTTPGQSFGVLVRGGTNSADYAFAVRNAGDNDLMRVLGNGNVGIGTVSPQRTLDLGTSGQLTFGNNGYSSTGSPGFFWYVDNTNYGIYKTAGSWSGPNYQQLMLNFPTGVVIDGGSVYGKSGTVLQPNGGSVGIGKTPDANVKLDVNGTISGNNVVAKYQDVAEWVPSSEELAAGTVVVLDSTKSNQVTSSSVSYDTRVAGVVSEQPGIALGEKSEGKVLVATTGRVRVKVDATKSPIHIGDLLVTSDISGVAMKSEPVDFAGRKMHMPGTLIGKALEPLEKGKGEILVLLSLQ